MAGCNLVATYRAGDAGEAAEGGVGVVDAPVVTPSGDQSVDHVTSGDIGSGCERETFDNQLFPPWPEAPDVNVWIVAGGSVRAVSTGSAAAQYLRYPAASPLLGASFRATAVLTVGRVDPLAGAGLAVFDSGLLQDPTVPLLFCGVYGETTGGAARALAGDCDPSSPPCVSLRGTPNVPAVGTHQVELSFATDGIHCTVDGKSSVFVPTPGWWSTRAALALFVDNVAAEFFEVQVCPN
ncbi:MAG: hypothetical protein KC503_38650 [Myxococcales bacterium]|nr:hypothetical protein [Myxococcales bacterium]